MSDKERFYTVRLHISEPGYMYVHEESVWAKDAYHAVALVAAQKHTRYIERVEVGEKP